MRKPTLKICALAFTLALGLTRAQALALDPGGSPITEKKPASKTGIEWAVTPAHVVVFLDGKKLGDAGSLSFTETKPGKHAVKLMKGADETESEVKVSKGQVLKFEFEFTDG